MVGQWETFKKWSPEEATKWMAGGFKAHKIKYWKAKEVSLKDAAEWARMGVTSTTHMAMRETLITADQWGEWKDTTHIMEAADWIRLGFTKEQAQIWKKYRVLPMQEKILRGNITPMEAREWLHTGFEAPQIIIWRSAIPNTKAAKWCESDIAAPEAHYFKKGGWSHKKPRE
ncbi:hypothetical protein DSO57_1006173 [Entomophthora muscae]|uniref:Uncharacterized protein n=1 Tax=Entomophthora muscae TaxID=34485 RepID=A0ACC2UTN2_9FUNG|nr:hypothetical protein DSO57_1006173 [Entomophthora muscae]